MCSSLARATNSSSSVAYSLSKRCILRLPGPLDSSIASSPATLQHEHGTSVGRAHVNGVNCATSRWLCGGTRFPGSLHRDTFVPHPNTAMAATVASSTWFGCAATKAAMIAVMEQPLAVMDWSMGSPLLTRQSCVPSVICRGRPGIREFGPATRAGVHHAAPCTRLYAECTHGILPFRVVERRWASVLAIPHSQECVHTQATV